MTRQTEEEVGRQHQGMDRPGARQSRKAVENRGKWRKMDGKSSAGPQRPRRLKDRLWRYARVTDDNSNTCVTDDRSNTRVTDGSSNTHVTDGSSNHFMHMPLMTAAMRVSLMGIHMSLTTVAITVYTFH